MQMSPQTYLVCMVGEGMRAGLCSHIPDLHRGVCRTRGHGLAELSVPAQPHDSIGMGLFGVGLLPRFLLFLTHRLGAYTHTHTER